MFELPIHIVHSWFALIRSYYSHYLGRPPPGNPQICSSSMYHLWNQSPWHSLSCTWGKTVGRGKGRKGTFLALSWLALRALIVSECLSCFTAALFCVLVIASQDCYKTLATLSEVYPFFSHALRGAHEFQVEGDLTGDRVLTVLALGFYRALLNKQPELNMKVGCQYLINSVRSCSQHTVSGATPGLN